MESALSMNSDYKVPLTDHLTELYSRDFFSRELNRLSVSDSYPITIITVDVDGLKLINDASGYGFGDEILRTSAAILKKASRKNDILARIGGDDFSCILPETDERTGEMVVRRVERFAAEHNKSFPEKQVKLSLGLATAEKKDDSNNNLVKTFKEAEDLMCRIKLHKPCSVRSQILAALLAALGERDFITKGHVDRLDEYSLVMGRKVGLSYRKLCNLSLLTKVHDIGKMGVPDCILDKKGPLDKEEFVKMKQHSVKGSRIALASLDLVGVADLILKHHERWDGKGYPLGLSGEEIPVECRILAIVDSFDAMTNDRPYRKRMSDSDALNELKNCSGSQFDPELVDVFFEVFSEKQYLR